MINSEKPVLMIHEMTEEMFDLPLENYTLTFDDGLYSQYKYLDKLKAINTQKIFFVSTGIICPEDITQSEEALYCGDSHKKAFEGNFENYMKWSQVEEIFNTENCFIGGHSHAHRDLRPKHIGARGIYNHCTEDTKIMMQNFKEHNMKPHQFCFPYNFDDSIYKGVLKRFKFDDFYAGERMAIEILLEEI